MLWGESWPNLAMKIADAPRHSVKKKDKLETAEDVMNFFESTNDG